MGDEALCGTRIGRQSRRDGQPCGQNVIAALAVAAQLEAQAAALRYRSSLL